MTLAKAPGQRESGLGKGVTNVLGERNKAAPTPALGTSLASGGRGLESLGRRVTEGTA